MIQSPCLNCEKRKINCHNDCKDYIKFKFIRYHENKIINKHKTLDAMLNGIDIKKRKRRK